MRIDRLLAAAAFCFAAVAPAEAAVPAGSYQQSCSGITAGADNILRAQCRAMSGAMVSTTLKLPCNGSIDNINGTLTCTGAPASGVPPGSYLQSCGDARVQDNTLYANCRRANQTVAAASLKLPCTGRIDNLNGVLTCVGGAPSPAPTPTPTTLTCAAGTVPLDGKSCVTLTKWAAGTALPDGTKIAIKLRKVNRNYYGGTEAWPRYVGVSPKDASMLDAVDESLTSRNLFEIKSFQASQYYNMPWFTMKTSAGTYAGRKLDGSGKLSASFDENNADLFVRDGDRFQILAYKWKDRQTYYDQVSRSGGFYKMCLSAFNVGSKVDGVGQWLDGGAPNYGCYVSGDVDFYSVK